MAASIIAAGPADYCTVRRRAITIQGMNAICLVVDRLHAGYVGALGNTWVDTPALDRLATESLVCDQMLVDSPQLELLYRSYWQGWHALCPPPPRERPTLAGLLRDAEVTSALLTDDPAVREHPLAADFDDLIPLDPPWQERAAGPGRIEDTHLARCFIQVIDWLQAARRPFLLWCHLGSLGATWDAPPEFRRRYWEEGDPPPPATSEVPDRPLPPDADPDELLGVSQAYAGQVSLLDACLGGLEEFLRQSKLARDTALVLCSARGFPLGDHGRIGPGDEALYGELVHVPLWLRLPGGPGKKGEKGEKGEGEKGDSPIFAASCHKNWDSPLAAARSQALVEPADVWATLLDCWGIAGPASPTAASLLPLARGESVPPRDRLCIAGRNGQRAIRTPAWYLRRAAVTELFAKPDDFWEVNNVAVRCPEVVECLEDALAQFAAALPGRAAELPALSDVLLHGLE
jgi:hypothetical protein